MTRGREESLQAKNTPDRVRAAGSGTASSSNTEHEEQYSQTTRNNVLSQ
eukprot:COSAG01_NODE_38873_length_484_cov_0.719481_1_plen_48_part_10